MKIVRRGSPTVQQVRYATVYVSFAGIQLRVPTLDLKETGQDSEDLLKGRKPFDLGGMWCGLNLIE